MMNGSERVKSNPQLTKCPLSPCQDKFLFADHPPRTPHHSVHLTYVMAPPTGTNVHAAQLWCRPDGTFWH